MPLTVELPPELETQVRAAAEAEGVDISTFLREAAAAHLPSSLSAGQMSDDELLRRIGAGFSEAVWNRYRALVIRRNARTLTGTEQQELISHTDRVEARDAERLVFLTELARRRNTSVRALIAELDLRPVAVE